MAGFVYVLMAVRLFLTFISDEPEVNVVNNGKDKLTSLVNIISYDLAVKAEDGIQVH